MMIAHHLRRERRRRLSPRDPQLTISKILAASNIVEYRMRLLAKSPIILLKQS